MPVQAGGRILPIGLLFPIYSSSVLNMPDALLNYSLFLTLFKVKCAHETIEKTFFDFSRSFDVHKKEKREKVGERERKKIKTSMPNFSSF